MILVNTSAVAQVIVAGGDGAATDDAMERVSPGKPSSFSVALGGVIEYGSGKS